MFRFGGELLGLDERFKSFESLLRKIALGVHQSNLKRLEPGIEANEKSILPSVIWRIRDALRYTIVVESSAYAEAVLIAVESFSSHGINAVALKNYWVKGNG